MNSNATIMPLLHRPCRLLLSKGVPRLCAVFLHLVAPTIRAVDMLMSLGLRHSGVEIDMAFMHVVVVQISPHVCSFYEIQQY